MAGQDITEEDWAEWDRTDRIGKDRAGQNWTEEGRALHDMTGQDGTGKDKVEPDRTG